MKVAITSEYHFIRGPDGVYTDSMYPYEFWARHLTVFDELVLVARARGGPLPAGARRVDGPRVRFEPIRDFVGTDGLLGGLWALTGTARRLARECDAFILRAPGVISTAFHEVLRLTGKRFGIQVVGDPAESLRRGTVAMRAWRPLSTWQLAEQVRRSAASHFVTERHLQERYRPAPGAFTIGASDVELPDALFDARAAAIRPETTLDLGFVGMLVRPYKGLDVLLHALARTRRPHRVAIVGDGPMRPELAALADTLGLGERVTWRGLLPAGGAIHDFLRSADMFVLSSRAGEGMPRTLLEAMALGLPCLATAVGGVPEVIGAEELVPPEDPAALADAIDALAADPARRMRLALHNRTRASDFRASVCEAKREHFLRAVKSQCVRQPGDDVGHARA
jgi:phosphatidyl-myo-inositol dimannoside synthase